MWSTGAASCLTWHAGAVSIAYLKSGTSGTEQMLHNVRSSWSNAPAARQGETAYHYKAAMPRLLTHLARGCCAAAGRPVHIAAPTRTAAGTLAQCPCSGCTKRQIWLDVRFPQVHHEMTADSSIPCNTDSEPAVSGLSSSRALALYIVFACHIHLGTGADARCASIVRSASRLFARSARFFSSCTLATTLSEHSGTRMHIRQV